MFKPESGGRIVSMNSRMSQPLRLTLLIYSIRSARSPYPRGTPQNEFRRLAVYPGNIPAEPDKPRQDPGETGKKVSQNLCKIWSGRVPGASGIGPGPFRNAPERRKRKKTSSGAQKSSKHFSRERFFVIFDVRPGAQNRQKTGPGPKKCVRKRRRKRFLSVFLAVSVRSRSPDRFWLDFSPKITPESREFFHAST